MDVMKESKEYKKRLSDMDFYEVVENLYFKILEFRNYVSKVRVNKQIEEAKKYINLLEGPYREIKKRIKKQNDDDKIPNGIENKIK